MSQVTAPADRRFRRAHLKPGRRRGRWRAALWWAVKYAVLVAVAVLGTYTAADALLRLPGLKIDRLVIRGNGRLSADEIRTILGGLQGAHIVTTDLEPWRQHLMTSPWVADATLRRSLPSTVRVFVSEKTPLAIGRLDGELYLVDDQGAVIDRYGPDYADIDLPIVDGLQPGRGEPVDPLRADLAGRLIDSLRGHPELARRLSQVDVSDVRNAAVILGGEPAVVHVGDERFAERIQEYLELAGTVRERVPDIDYVDLRFDGRVFVGPAARGRQAGQVSRGSPVRRGPGNGR